VRQGLHPSIVELLRFFQHEHLPEHLKPTAKACGLLAHSMVDELPSNAELTTGLRKLLEAKDCFVRAALR
jgi:hypothetical protein